MNADTTHRTPVWDKRGLDGQRVSAERSRWSRTRQGPSHQSDAYLAARAIVERYGRDSLSRFLLRPDKAFHFAAGGVLGYRVIGRTAIVSADPVAPEGAEVRVLASFLDLARRRRLKVVLWGVSGLHLESYGALGFRCVCAGEEAFVAPERFTLGGRRVRKLRQSVHRIERRGWTLSVLRGGELTPDASSEIRRFDRSWSAEQSRLLGFAMGFGSFESEVEEGDLYLLAHAPEGDLRAVMRFVAHCGRLSLDTMHRLGETPNGLNEALVCRALETARTHGVPEVSLNYAGLGHLVRAAESPEATRGRFRHAALNLLSGHFQMERLVRFNEKFFPDWRPRFLLYPSRMGFPGAVLRVLQAEGHIPELGFRRGTRSSADIAAVAR